MVGGNETEVLESTIEDHLDDDEPARETANKHFKFGIIYLSCIPEGLNVKILREMMGQFGEVGRIYLAPEPGNKKRRTYSEGWIEFKKKRVAKSVAKSLNGTPLQYGRKHCKMNGQIWNIKYLHKFKWAHLTEQLAYDQAVKNQKRSFEMTQAKKQVDFYQKMTERSKLMKKIRSKNHDPDLDEKKLKAMKSKQNMPKSGGSELTVPVDEDLLKSIFKRVD